MSELGVFAVDRAVFSHPLLTTGEPFSRREAWLWLISEAAWKPRKVGRIGAVIELERGQLAHSVRFIADAWGWSKSSVDRFLTRLKTGTMIGTSTGTGLLVITICNYDAYQRLGLPDRDSNRDAERDTSGTAAGQTRNIQSIKEEDMSEPAGGSDAPKPKTEKRARVVYTPEYEELWRLYPSTEGMSKMDGFKAWQKLSLAEHVQVMAALPAYAALLKRTPDRPVKHVQGFLNGRMFESFGGSVSQMESPVVWETRLQHARGGGEWATFKWGPAPGQAGCRVPTELLLADDGVGWKEHRSAA